MRQFLEEEEQLYLQGLDREEELFQPLPNSQVRMTQNSERMKDMYRELWELSHMPGVELPQEVGNALARTDLAQMQKPQLVNPELTSWGITGVQDVLNKFRVGNSLSTEMVPRSISLSEDVRQVTFGDDHHSAVIDPPGVESFALRGAQAFSSHRHYWEVDVTYSSDWILGVCKDSRTADTNIIIGSDERFFFFSISSKIAITIVSPTLQL
ncbi:tripartite motif-containing protein 64C-like [Sapajus apella]|uniref:Tripartite motif-containing protein 64C-like n=1 Tax=Sapajus apella TaxID=9515 RepID=A0A6J3HH04_SAPAP|nr:tripartite motif-containing protein 64C-like [Sapajus apella]